MIEYGILQWSPKDVEEQYDNNEHGGSERTALDREGIEEAVIARFEDCYDCLWEISKSYRNVELGVAETTYRTKPIFRLALENHLINVPLDQWLSCADARIDVSNYYDGQRVRSFQALGFDFIADVIGPYKPHAE